MNKSAKNQGNNQKREAGGRQAAGAKQNQSASANAKKHPRDEDGRFTMK